MYNYRTTREIRTRLAYELILDVNLITHGNFLELYETKKILWAYKTDAFSYLLYFLYFFIRMTAKCCHNTAPLHEF